MAYENTYGWENVRRSMFTAVPESRNLRWWIFIAVLLSVFVHVVLYLVFLNWKTEWMIIAESKTKEMTRPTIPKNAKKYNPDIVKKPEEKDKRNLDVTELEEVDIDPLDVENLLERDIKFTPEFDKPANILANTLNGLDPGDTGPALRDLKIATDKKLKDDLAKMNKKLLEEAKRASENQPEIEIPIIDPGAIDPNALVDDVNAKEGDGVGDSRYSTLDELLNYGGPLGDNTKPIMMPTDVLFQFGEWTLLPQAKLSLMKLGLLIQGNPGTRFIIEGHTDTIGPDDYNLKLSKKRAEAVRDWLLKSLGFDDAQLQSVGHGETKPIVDGEGDREAQSKNRRVEIVMKTKKSNETTEQDGTPSDPTP